MAGHDVVREADAVRRAIGVALQEAAIDPLMTGRELLRMQGALHGLRGATARERARQLLDRVGLTEAADRRVGGYSGGMRRRLDLALALVHRPQVLFLDEPTTGLDPTSRAALWREVRALNDEGTTVFLTTQYLEEAEQLADRVGIIAAGPLVAEGTPDVAEGARRRADACTSSWPTRRRAERACAALAGAGRGRAAAARRDRARRCCARRRARRRSRRSSARSTSTGSRSSRRRGRDADARRRLPRRHRLAPRGRRRTEPGRSVDAA